MTPRSTTTVVRVRDREPVLRETPLEKARTRSNDESGKLNDESRDPPPVLPTVTANGYRCGKGPAAVTRQ